MYNFRHISWFVKVKYLYTTTFLWYIRQWECLFLIKHDRIWLWVYQLNKYTLWVFAESHTELWNSVWHKLWNILNPSSSIGSNLVYSDRLCENKIFAIKGGVSSRILKVYIYVQVTCWKRRKRVHGTVFEDQQTLSGLFTFTTHFNTFKG